MDINFHFDYKKEYDASSLFEEFFKNRLSIITETANTTERDATVSVQLYENYDELLGGLNDLIKDGFSGDVDDLGCYLHENVVGITVKASCDHRNDYSQVIKIYGLNLIDQNDCLKHIEEVLDIKAD